MELDEIEFGKIYNYKGGPEYMHFIPCEPANDGDLVDGLWFDSRVHNAHRSFCVIRASKLIEADK